MAMKFDSGKGREAVETLVRVLNGEAQTPVVDAYKIAVAFGEDSPMAEALRGNFKEFEKFYNEEFLPMMNKVKENMEGYNEFADMFKTLSIAKVAGAGDMGTVQGHNYDAGKDL